MRFFAKLIFCSPQRIYSCQTHACLFNYDHHVFFWFFFFDCYTILYSWYWLYVVLLHYGLLCILMQAYWNKIVAVHAGILMKTLTNVNDAILRYKTPKSLCLNEKLRSNICPVEMSWMLVLLFEMICLKMRQCWMQCFAHACFRLNMEKLETETFFSQIISAFVWILTFVQAPGATCNISSQIEQS